MPLYDGTQRGSRDVAIKGDRIVGVGTFAVLGQPRVIDAAGLMVTPGFIDLHTHSDSSLQNSATRDNRNYLMQGVTTVVTGNCGSGPHDVAAYFEKLEKGGTGSNVIHQAPHNDIRAKVMGNVNRSPTPEELEKMKVSSTSDERRPGAYRPA